MSPVITRFLLTWVRAAELLPLIPIDRRDVQIGIQMPQVRDVSEQREESSREWPFDHCDD